MYGKLPAHKKARRARRAFGNDDCADDKRKQNDTANQKNNVLTKLTEDEVVAVNGVLHDAACNILGGGSGICLHPEISDVVDIIEGLRAAKKCEDNLREQYGSRNSALFIHRKAMPQITQRTATMMKTTSMALE